MAKTALNKQSYIDAALALISEEGFDNVSMRNVAAKLGVSAMAMYKHFPNKEALLSSALDDFIGRANVLPDADMNWDQWLVECAKRMFMALSDEIDWVPLLGALRPGEQAAMVSDQFIAKLKRAGFSASQATDAYFAVIQSVIGAACLQVSLRIEKHATKNVDGGKVQNSRLQIECSLELLIAALRLQLNESKNERTA
jgi:AcrR family transcriptional regulator